MVRNSISGVVPRVPLSCGRSWWLLAAAHYSETIIPAFGSRGLGRYIAFAPKDLVA